MMLGKQPDLVRQFLRTEFFRYIVSGSIAFIFDFSVLVFCTEVLAMHYLYSNIAGYAVGLVVSYTINVRWVFNYRRFNGKQRREFSYFTLIVLVGLVTSELVLWLVTESSEIHYTWAKVVATFFVFLFNFITKKWLLFSPAQA